MPLIKQNIAINEEQPKDNPQPGRLCLCPT